MSEADPPLSSHVLKTEAASSTSPGEGAEVVVPLEDIEEAIGAEPLPVAMPAPRRSVGRTVFLLVGALAGGNLLAMALRMAGGLIQARLVAPSVLGLFNSFGLILGYVPFLNIGVFNGLNREFPYFIGKGNRDHAQELAGVTQSWAFLLSGTVCTVMLGVALWKLLQGDLESAAGLATNAFLAISLYYATYYLQSTYRTSGDFTTLALANVIINSTAVAFVVFVVLFGYYGICLRALLVGVVSIASSTAGVPCAWGRGGTSPISRISSKSASRSSVPANSIACGLQSTRRWSGIF